MSKKRFYLLLQKELERVDCAKTAKRNEKILEGFTNDHSPQAIIGRNKYRIFNSNDYLGLRFDETLKKAEKTATDIYGTGPGAVRFISGTMKVHKDLENAIASFHKREDAIVYSSAFAANLAVISCLAKGQSKDSVVSAETLIISDELNHRSIIDGIRVSGLPKEQKLVFSHLSYTDLERILKENAGKYKRVLVITDGIFSMLGEYANLRTIQDVIKKYDRSYEQGVLLVTDDSHGVGACGTTGRGCEELCEAESDVLVGTFGKAFGSDGGYAVADKIIIDYLREASATYIYSNSISPGVAGAALQAIRILEEKKGTMILRSVERNISQFKTLMEKAGFAFAADSHHPIQPILVGDPKITKKLTGKLFASGILVTPINYPVVPKGRDEIRVQISASHTFEDIEYFVKYCTKAAKELHLL